MKNIPMLVLMTLATLVLGCWTAMKRSPMWALMVSLIVFCVCIALKTMGHIPVMITLAFFLLSLVGYVARIVWKECKKSCFF